MRHSGVLTRLDKWTPPTLPHTHIHTHLFRDVSGTCEYPWGSPGFRQACAVPSRWACSHSGCSWTASQSSTACLHGQWGQRGEAADCQSEPAWDACGRLVVIQTKPGSGFVTFSLDFGANQNLQYRNLPYLSVRSIKVSILNSFHASIGPIQAFGLIVNGKPIGPRQVGRDDDHATWRVHPGTLNLWVGAPVSPVHETMEKRRLFANVLSQKVSHTLHISSKYLTLQQGRQQCPWAGQGSPIWVQSACSHLH